MEMQSRLRIGGWSADRSTNELSRGGETRRIEPKAMEVLLALAGSAGQVVTRERLLSTLWPGVVVGDEALLLHRLKLLKTVAVDHEAEPRASHRSRRKVGAARGGWAPRFDMAPRSLTR